MDRTNWQFGNTDINILMVGIVYKETSIPLMRDLLDKRDNSSTEERKEFVERVFKSIGKHRSNLWQETGSLLCNCYITP